MALTVSARSRFTGPSTPTLIKAAAVCAAVGIAASLGEYADYGKWLTVAGVLLLIVGLHRFGRLGPDAPIVFELPTPRKKRKRRKQASHEQSDAAERETESEDTAGLTDDGEPGTDAERKSRP